MSIAPKPSTVFVPDLQLPYPTILDFLERRFSDIGREIWRNRLNSGKVLDAHFHPLSAQMLCIPRTKLYYFREVSNEPRVPFSEKILYQDDYSMVVCKPHFLPVIPSGPYVNECLLYRLQKNNNVKEISPINRLDRETAGLVLFSLQKKTEHLYHSLFQNGQVIKHYEAIAHCNNKLNFSSGLIQSRIIRGKPFFRMKNVDGIINAKTNIMLISQKNNKAYFNLIPITGKKHQLRIHLSTIHCRILNDRYYPTLLPEEPPDFTKPLQLLAKRLIFMDPLSGEKRDFQSPRKLQY